MYRIIPNSILYDYPCSIVAVDSAKSIQKHGKIINQIIVPPPEGLYDNGYLPLKEMNRYIRSQLSVKKYVNYKRVDRFPLKQFLADNKERAVVCVLGHYIYVDEDNYYSFYDNTNDPVVGVWYLKNTIDE